MQRNLRRALHLEGDFLDFEIGKRSPHPRTLAAIRSALEAAGVEFIANGDGPGVRLRKPAG